MPWQEFYETTLKALQEAKNDRLWFKTNLKLGKLWFDREEYPRLLKILKEYAPRERAPMPCDGAHQAPHSAQPPFALCPVCHRLHKSCEGPDGTDDPKKGTQLLEVYALEIQMCGPCRDPSPDPA